MSTLETEYQTWVQSHIDYNTQCATADPQNAANYITDKEAFIQNYPAENFYESQYNEYMQQYYPPQTEAQPAPEQAPVVEEPAPTKVEEVKSSPETKDSEIKKAPEAEEPENEANGLDFDEME